MKKAPADATGAFSYLNARGAVFLAPLTPSNV
jgi:hypothetical protein